MAQAVLPAPVREVRRKLKASLAEARELRCELGVAKAELLQAAADREEARELRCTLGVAKTELLQAAADREERQE